MNEHPFAEPLRNLIEMGVTEPTLRWLVLKGYAEHAHELTTFREANRRFRPSPNVLFAPKTCFVLTEAGTEFMRDEPQEASLPASILLFRTLAAVSSPVPHWDRPMRTLSLGDRIVKRYRVLAKNQEIVLSAFEEAGWTHIIDDPLALTAESYVETRLRDTIRRLNSNQANRLLHFYGDGTACHILWETVADATLPLESACQKMWRAA